MALFASCCTNWSVRIFAFRTRLVCLVMLKTIFLVKQLCKGVTWNGWHDFPPLSFFSDCRNEELLPSWPTFLSLSTVIGQTISKAELQTQLIHRLDPKKRDTTSAFSSRAVLKFFFPTVPWLLFYFFSEGDSTLRICVWSRSSVCDMAKGG